MKDKEMCPQNSGNLCVHCIWLHQIEPKQGEGSAAEPGEEQNEISC
jgi:hypothetical protein